ncbi:MAG: PP2C family protein-serine/threonine phosphatase, partial [Bdellovibrionota bacterium]
METQSIKHLLVLYTAILLFNTVISVALWVTQRTPLYRYLSLFWISGAFALIVQGATAQGGKWLIALGGTTVFLAGFSFAYLMATTVGFHFSAKPFLFFAVACYLFLILCIWLGIGFPWIGIPEALTTTPMFYTALVALSRFRSRLTFSQKGLAVSAIFFTVHTWDFPILRPLPELAPWGFTIAIFIGFAISVFTLSIASETLSKKVTQLESDLEVTGAVQALFLPKARDFSAGSVHVASYYQSAIRSGGDWWWHEELLDGRQILLLGDVTGHGLGPAMITGVMASSFRTLKKTLPDVSLEQIFVILNDTLFGIAGETYQMTMSVLEFSADREQLKWGTAASPPLYIVGSDGAAEVLSKQGAPLGQLGTKFTIGSRKLKSGDRIFAFTDGVYEFETKGAGRAFGL